MALSLLVEKRPASQDIREYAYHTIKRNILDMRLLPGDQLSEAMMADRLDISRTPVHDTFARLTEEGLVSAIPQKGTSVAPLSSAKIEQGLFMQVQLGRAVADRICRSGLPASAVFALEANQNQQDFLLSSRRFDSLPELDAQFHEQFYEACGLPDVWHALTVACSDIRRLQAVAVRDPGLWDILAAEHRELFRALCRQDHDRVCALLERHYSHAADWLTHAREQNPSYFTESAPGE